MGGAHFIATGNLVSYSEMQFVNCDYGLTKNLGCNGGLMDKAFTYAETNAITTEEAYPYTPKKSSCDTSKLEGAARLVTKFVDVAVNDPAALKVQSQSPSRLTSSSSNPTSLVLSLTPSAEPTLTTVSSPSDMALTPAVSNTTLLRTPGDQAGDTTDTSTSESKMAQVSAVSKVDHPPNQLLTELEDYI